MTHAADHCAVVRDRRVECSCGWRSPPAFFDFDGRRMIAWHFLAVGEAIDNPLLKEFLAPVYQDEIDRNCGSEFAAHRARRDRVAAEYAWAIPTENVVRKLAELSPICELGCGTGYWAKLLTDVGASVIAVDADPPLTGRNHFHPHIAGLSRQRATIRHFAAIVEADAATFDVPKTHTLMLCWPPYNDGMAAAALKRYRGDRVIYIGEIGGCTADDVFHADLEANWTLTAAYEIPQWDGIHDDVNVYVRKGNP
jgi:SAM-dependent methyltransferase